MKKIFIAAIAAVLTLSGFNAVAQTQAENNNKEKTEQTIQKKNKRHGDCRRDFKRNANRNENCCIIESSAFEGITLTADQQAKLDQLKAKQLAKAKERKAQLKEQQQKARKERLEGRKQAKKEYLTEVKEILTPDQYVIYLENIAVNQPQGKHSKMHRHNGNK